MRIEVQADPFDYGAEAGAFAAGVDGAGAVVSFAGIVRDRPGGGLLRMEIEHYPGMTEKALAAIAGEARARWSLNDALILHRHGAMQPGEVIMMVATAAPHRADAFAAAEAGALRQLLARRRAHQHATQHRIGIGNVQPIDREGHRGDGTVAGVERVLVDQHPHRLQGSG